MNVMTLSKPSAFSLSEPELKKVEEPILEIIKKMPSLKPGNFLAQDPFCYDLAYKAHSMARLIKKSSPAISACVNKAFRMIISLKLGGEITPEDLQNNPEYETFILKNRWAGKALRYNFTVPKVKGKPGVLYNGHKITFNRLLKLEHPFYKTPLVNPSTKELFNTSITQKGIIIRAKNGEDLLFCHEEKNPASWQNRYVFEIVTCVQDEKIPNFSRDHAWLRLKNAKGKVFSWGAIKSQFSFKKLFLEGAKMMLDGAASMPDFFESREKNEKNELATPFAITYEQYKEAKAYLNRLNTKGIPFCFGVGLTCQGHVVHLAEKLGIKAEGKIGLAELVFKKFFGKKIVRLSHFVVPKFIRIAFAFIADVFLGLFMRFFQIHSVDKKVKEEYGHEYDRHLTGIFNPRVKVQIPAALRKWQKEIAYYRNREGKDPFAILEKYKCESAFTKRA